MLIPKQSQYPKKIYLRGEVYSIRFVKGLKSLGITNWSKNTIKIRAGMSRNETFRAFLHEVLHFLEFEWPIKLPHKTVYKLEKAIFQLIMDNFL